MALRKMLLEINGVERQIVCEPTDTLGDMLRALGLTGTKMGCGAGQCGACSVLVDGKVTKPKGYWLGMEFKDRCRAPDQG